MEIHEMERKEPQGSPDRALKKKKREFDESEGMDLSSSGAPAAKKRNKNTAVLLGPQNSAFSNSPQRLPPSSFPYIIDPSMYLFMGSSNPTAFQQDNNNIAANSIGNSSSSSSSSSSSVPSSTGGGGLHMSPMYGFQLLSSGGFSSNNGIANNGNGDLMEYLKMEPNQFTQNHHYMQQMMALQHQQLIKASLIHQLQMQQIQQQDTISQQQGYHSSSASLGQPQQQQEQHTIFTNNPVTTGSMGLGAAAAHHHHQQQLSDLMRGTTSTSHSSVESSIGNDGSFGSSSSSSSVTGRSNAINPSHSGDRRRRRSTLTRHSSNEQDDLQEQLDALARVEGRVAREGPPRPQFTSVYRGVSWHKRDKIWLSRAFISGKVRHLGCFRSELVAALVVDLRLLQHHNGDESKVTNFLDPKVRQELIDNYDGPEKDKLLQVVKEAKECKLLFTDGS